MTKGVLGCLYAKPFHSDAGLLLRRVFNDSRKLLSEASLEAFFDDASMRVVRERVEDRPLVCCVSLQLLVLLITTG